MSRKLFFALMDSVAFFYRLFTGATYLYDLVYSGVIVRVYVAKRLFPGWAAGLTLGRNIFLIQSEYSNPYLLNHELWHVCQGKRLGLLFLWKYLISWARSGYMMDELEVDARKHADRRYEC